MRGALVALLALGCADDPERDACEGACVPLEACVEGRCRPRPCHPDDAPCPAPGVCVAGSCQPDPGVSECLEDAECGAEGYCVEGECFQGCPEGETRPCQTACGAGEQSCRGAVWRPCDARQPAAERCDDGVDQDCDARIDEGCDPCADGEERPCETACGAGLQRCTDVWQPCDAPLPGEEICADGQDQDCDGAVDEGCPAICRDEARRPPGDVRVDRGPDPAAQPHLVWTGQAWLAAWHTHRPGPAGTTFVQRLGPAGERLGEPTPVADRFLDAVALAGDRLAVFTVEVSRVSVSVVTPLGGVQGAPAPIELGRITLYTAAWTGSDLAIVYDKFQQDRVEDLYLARVGLDGRIVAPEVRLRAAQRVLSARMTWTGGGFFLTWAEPHDGDPFAPDLFVTRFDARGRPSGPPRPLARGRDGSLAPGPDGYGLAFTAHREGQPDAVGFVRLGSDATPAGPATLVSDSPGNARDPSLVWTGSAYGVLWADARDGPADLWFRRLDPTGAPLEAPTRLVALDGDDLSPTLRWNGAGYGAGWMRRRADAFTDIWFTGGPFACE